MKFPELARVGLAVACGLAVPLLLEPAALVIVPNQEVEPNNTPATATTISLTSCPPVVSGLIRPIGDVDYYRVVVPTGGGKLWARVDTAASNTGTDSVLTLFASDGTTVLETDDDDGLGNGCDTTVETMFASAIAGKTLSAGTYYLQVKHFSPAPPESPSGTITPYTLEVVLTPSSNPKESESTDTVATANAIVATPGTFGVREAEIKQVGDVDYYSVTAAAGSSLFVSVDQDPGRTSDNQNPTGADVVIDVIAPDGTTQLMEVDNTGDTGLPNPPAEAFCFGVPAAGTYFLRISGFTLPPPDTFSSTGVYHLMVSNCSPIAATPTPTSTPTPTRTPTNTPTNTATSTRTPTPTNTATSTRTQTPTTTPTPTRTITPGGPTLTPTPTATLTATPTASPTPTLTATPTSTPTVTPTSGPVLAGYYTLTPCRVADTRDPDGPYGGPALSAGAARSFALAGRCGIPPEADAVALNVIVTQPTAPGFLTLYPLGVTPPLASTINYGPGQTRANNAIVQLGSGDSIAVVCGQSSGATHAILDVVGYFRFVGP
jgi:hypothetical protein